MCLRIASPAIKRVGNGGRPGLSSYTAPKRCSSNDQSIVRDSFTSGCSMSMIASSRERRRSACPLSRRSFGRIVPSDATEAITGRDSRESRKRNCKLLRPHTPRACNLKCRCAREIDSRSMAWEVLHGRLSAAVSNRITKDTGRVRAEARVVGLFSITMPAGAVRSRHA